MESTGFPEQIHSDNGEPFAGVVSLSRLTRLSVWFMELGIIPVYSDPEKGSHERMHKELKAEASTRRPTALAGSRGSSMSFADSTMRYGRTRR